MRSTLLRGVQLSALALLSLNSGWAVSIFSDDFEQEVSSQNATLANWTIARQAVDVVGPPGFTCNSGIQCVDLDGSTTSGGRIESQNFTFLAGVTYTLTFWLSENQRGYDFAGNPDEVTVSLGALGQQVIQLQNTANFTFQQYSIQVVGDGSIGAIVFDHGGGDNVGIILDDVNLDEDQGQAADVPEPATFGLIGAGLVMFALRRRA